VKRRPNWKERGSAQVRKKTEKVGTIVKHSTLQERSRENGRGGHGTLGVCQRGKRKKEAGFLLLKPGKKWELRNQSDDALPIFECNKNEKVGKGEKSRSTN